MYNYSKRYMCIFCVQYQLFPTITDGDALVSNVKYSAREMCIWRPTISSINFEALLWTAKCRWRTVFRFLQDYFHSSSPRVHCLHFSTCTRKMHSDNKMTDCFILSGEWAESIKQSIARSFWQNLLPVLLLLSAHVKSASKCSVIQILTKYTVQTFWFDSCTMSTQGG